MKSRPVFLNLFAIRFPIMAIVSILHRVSGVILFLLIPFFLCSWEKSLSSPSDFSVVKAWFHTPGCKFILFFSVVALFYHLVAGIRHLVMDVGFFESKEHGKLTSILVFGIVSIFAVWFGVKLW